MNQSQARRPRPLPEASYISLARRVLVASQLKQKAADDELQAKRECATSMHSVHMTEFDMNVEGKDYSVKLARRWVEQINVRKLYTLLANGEITLDEFLDCIEAPIKSVEETLGDDRVAFLKENVKKGLDLQITEEGK